MILTVIGMTDIASFWIENNVRYIKNHEDCNHCLKIHIDNNEYMYVINIHNIKMSKDPTADGDQFDFIPIMEFIRHNAEHAMKQLMVGHDVAGHGVDHMLDVANHATKALEYENIPFCDKIRVELAALYHDIDDPKIFKENKDYENARRLLKDILSFGVIEPFYYEEGSIMTQDDYCAYFIDKIIKIIDLVSCSKNGDKEPPFPYMAIPRDCDRLEAIGEIGIIRCKAFIEDKKAPYHLDSTVRAYTEEQVKEAATSERFTAYMNGSRSPSMIDHYYDKLLHIGNPESLRSQNPYILREAAKRNHIMMQFVIDYWKRQLTTM